MDIALIVLAIVGWYGVGILGSGLGMYSMDKRVGFREREDRVVGLVFAVFGVFNLVSAFLFALMNGQGLGFTWYWLGGKRRL